MTDRQIPKDARAEIERRLDAIESESGVTIVFACESGSRAWGFASPDSDYDVRFLYVSHPSWYLSVDLEDKRDVIETPIEGVWDVNGWDLRKALRLYRKSNPPLLEWLQSPIVYREPSGAAGKLRNLVPSFYSPTASMYHYLHMAQKNYRTYLREEEVWTKKVDDRRQHSINT
jgi:predicted nucleotidyltransferase